MIIVKRRGHKEKFDERKIYASCYAACFICNMEKKKCEKIANSISKEVSKIAKKKKSISSKELFKMAVKLLNKHSKEAAFMYETHRDIS